MLPSLTTLLEQLTGKIPTPFGTSFKKDDIYQAVAAYEKAYVKEAILAKRISGKQATEYITVSVAEGNKRLTPKRTLQKHYGKPLHKAVP